MQSLNPLSLSLPHCDHEDILAGSEGQHVWRREQRADEPAPHPRFGHTAVLIHDEMMIFGGRSQVYHSDVWTYNITAEKWSNISPDPQPAEIAGNASSILPEARAGHTATVLSENRMMVFGGAREDQHLLSDLWELRVDPEGYRWRLVHPGNENIVGIVRSAAQTSPDVVICPGRKGHTCVPYDGGLLVFGGVTNEPPPDNILWHWTEKGDWSKPATVGIPPCKRVYHVAEMSDSGSTMIVFGGQPLTESGNICTTVHLNDVHMFNTQTSTWREMVTAGDVPSGRMCSASVMRNGMFCVFLGGSTEALAADAHQLEIESMTWRKHPAVLNGEELPSRARPTCVAHGDRVTLFGGHDGKFVTRDVVQLSFSAPTLREFCRRWVRTNRRILEKLHQCGRKDATQLLQTEAEERMLQT